MKNYYKGSFYKDHDREYALRRGWLVGEFMTGVRKTDKVEIKFWRFKTSDNPNHPRKYQKTAIECFFIIKGKLEAEVAGDKVILSAGDYMVIPPEVPSNAILKILEDVEAFTIKAPSVAEDKVEVYKT